MNGELDAAVGAAEAAGDLLREGFGRQRSIRYKGEVDLVTEMDERAEGAIREALLGAFPDHGMLAEEGGSLSGGGDARWIVDPLDGTTNYAHGLPVFAVSVALERSGEVVLGVVHDPMRGETFVAEKGLGATLNGEALTPTGEEDLARGLVATGFPYDRNNVPAALELFGTLSLRAQGMRRLGAAALDLCYVAAGRLDAYYERGIHAWDVAAGALILEEAGGRITDYRGGPFEVEGGELVASNGPLHGTLLDFTAGRGG
ncbi:inositol monophosphatase [Rubrobacter tropicus]|uniref:Inositol-1-monophosphatase n=1 Tax=Rubrobacter tropicus TaxID=2653851 RepID=A0A6G8Q598_9ACTN|nr:inositol monophosphatase family protein [Rubrobacter tropicus]QIN81652.1 inositol monophosphatase [Rubrobacter tropicus]